MLELLNKLKRMEAEGAVELLFKEFCLSKEDYEVHIKQKPHITSCVENYTIRIILKHLPISISYSAECNDITICFDHDYYFLAFSGIYPAKDYKSMNILDNYCLSPEEFFKKISDKSKEWALRRMNLIF